MRHPTSTGPPRLLDDSRGLAKLEYLLITCLVVIGGFGAWQHVGATFFDSVDAPLAVLEDLPTTSTAPRAILDAVSAPIEDLTCGPEAAAPNIECNPDAFVSCVTTHEGRTVTVRCDPLLHRTVLVE